MTRFLTIEPDVEPRCICGGLIFYREAWAYCLTSGEPLEWNAYLGYHHFASWAEI